MRVDTSDGAAGWMKAQLCGASSQLKHAAGVAPLNPSDVLQEATNSDRIKPPSLLTEELDL